GDDCLLLLSELKMLVFDHPRVRHFTVSIVDHSIPLIVITVQHLCLKTYGTVLKGSQPVIKILINHAGKYDLLRYVRIIFSEFKEVHTCAHFRSAEHLLYDGGIPSDR